jgi:hypothetical protein
MAISFWKNGYGIHHTASFGWSKVENRRLLFIELTGCRMSNIDDLTGSHKQTTSAMTFMPA